MRVTTTPAAGAAPAGPPPGLRESTLRLSLPDTGITDGAVVLRTPREADVDGLMPAFSDPALREAGNLPAFGRAEMLASLEHLPAMATSGRLLPMIASDARTAEPIGGGTLHHLDAERAIVEIGYWILPHARRMGFATRIARLLAEHAFALGVERVAALRERRQPRLRRRPRARRVHPRGRRPVAARPRRPAAGQDAVLAPPRRAPPSGHRVARARRPSDTVTRPHRRPRAGRVASHAAAPDPAPGRRRHRRGDR